MIIGINGKIGSGKDTVGRIIQHLIYFDKTQIQPSLGINGHIADQILNPSYLHYELVTIRKTGWEDKKFAGKLKQIASLLTGIPVEMFEDQEFKKQYMPEEWAVEIWNDPDPIEGNDYRITSRIKYEDDTSLITYNDGLSEAEVFDHEIEKRLMTYREFLQKLGTEAMRNGLHTNTWVNALFADYKATVKEWDEFGSDKLVEYPSWCITDMRFPNEMKAVVERKGITIRVSRTGIHTPKVEDLHPSETALDNSEFDYHIDNSGTIEDLVEKVKEILIKENII